jgi:hypothetical protein
MSRKIIGVTVGSPLPKPNLKQTDPSKGDYVKGKDIIPTKLSQLEDDSDFVKSQKVDDLSDLVDRFIDGYGRVHDKLTAQQKTLDEHSERIDDIVALSDFELEMLNELLLNGTLRCAPEITATYNATNGVDPETDFAVYFYDVSATIKNIDKALIKKVEVGAGTRFGSTTTYEWFDAEPSFGDAIHTVDFSGKYLNFSGYFRPAVRLTYYHPLAGEEQILMVEAVKE